jgi:hypothetical protein
MILEDLEDAYRDAQQAAHVPQVIVTMHIDESAIRTLKPRLEAGQTSLSEHVRTLLRREAGTMPVPMMEVR